MVLAAGLGNRMNQEIPKQYQLINGKPLLFHTLNILFQISEINQIAVVIAPSDPYFDQFDWSKFDSLIVLRAGGISRFETVCQGFEALGKICTIESQDWLMTHDAVRCCIKLNDISGFIHYLKFDKIGGLLAIPVSDSLKKVNQGSVSKTMNRDNLWLAQTPQMFRVALLAKALQKNGDFSDEAEAIEGLGYKPTIVMGTRDNIKITYPSDLNFAKIFLTSFATKEIK
jgi:2-C-methyl-D-erythritol 4-phosphate cytidylyltransferase